jgi:hypothetical protein
MERFRHLVKLRIALAENVRKKGVDDLNHFLADVMPARFVQEAPLGGNETHVLPLMARRSAEGGDDEWY